MLEQTTDILHTYRNLIAIGLALLMTAIVIRHYWESISFWLMDFYNGLPLFGRVRSLAKNLELKENTGWFHAEEDLASRYMVYYDKIHSDPEYYDKCTSYLTRANELGRSPFAWYMWVIVFVMVAIEAMGFSYVLAGFAIPGASETLMRYGAVGISILISILLVGFTHFSGKELYNNSLLHKARKQWNADTSEPRRPLIESNHEINIENNYADNDEPKYIQLINRIPNHGDTKPRHKVTISTIVFVLVVAILATVVRGIVMERELRAETTGVVERISQGQSTSFFPSAMTTPQAAADKKSAEEGASLDRQGGWSTFIVLAVIFVFMQIFGVLTGFKFGFIGSESPKAYDTTSRFKSRKDYEAYVKSRKTFILASGNRRLLELQRRLAQNVMESGNSPAQKDAVSTIKNRDIYTFLERHLKNEDRADRLDKEHHDARVARNQAPKPEPRVEKIESKAEKVERVAVAASPVLAEDEETDEQMEARIRAEEAAKAAADKAAARKAREDAIRQRIKAEQSA